MVIQGRQMAKDNIFISRGSLDDNLVSPKAKKESFTEKYGKSFLINSLIIGITLLFVYLVTTNFFVFGARQWWEKWLIMFVFGNFFGDIFGIRIKLFFAKNVKEKNNIKQSLEKFVKKHQKISRPLLWFLYVQALIFLAMALTTYIDHTNFSELYKAGISGGFWGCVLSSLIAIGGKIFDSEKWKKMTAKKYFSRSIILFSIAICSYYVHFFIKLFSILGYI